MTAEKATVTLSNGEKITFGPLNCWDSMLVEKELGDPPYSVQSMSLAYAWRSHVTANPDTTGGMSFKKFCLLIPRTDQDQVLLAVAPFIRAASTGKE